MIDTVIELTLHAADNCKLCGDFGRPSHDETMEHGLRYFHITSPGKENPCQSAILWKLIDRIAARMAR